MKRNLMQSGIVLGAVLLIVLFVVRERLADWLSPPHFEAKKEAAVDDPWVYLCPMDGFQRSDAGICAVCNMPLTDEHQVRKSSISTERPITLTSDRVRAVGLKTEPIEERELVLSIRTVGRIVEDQRRMRDITARVDARVEKLHRNFIGQEVAAGDVVADLYSPDLVSTQDEMLLALKRGDARGAGAARERLLLWGLTEAQVAGIEKEGKARQTVPFVSQVAGVIATLDAHQGHWLKAGDHLMEIVDLGAVWLYADIYEFEIPFVHMGQKVTISAPAFPDASFEGAVSYRHPFVDEKTRTQRIRVAIDNPDRKLLPGMFVNATVRVPLGPGGAPVGPQGEIEVDDYYCHAHGAAAGPGECPTCKAKLDVRKVKKPFLEERTVWVCEPCCPDVREPKGGQCPKCPMQLKPKKETGLPRALAIRRSAVLDSGTRRFAFVESAPNQFKRVEVKLGPLAGDWYPVREGVKKGDKVVTAAAYLLDSQSQISGGASALYSGASEVKEEPKEHKH
jgi:Cu(I)/Ag(I) efflux system membrane fusion protein